MAANILVTISSVLNVLAPGRSNQGTNLSTASLQLLGLDNTPLNTLSSAPDPTNWPTNQPLGIWQDATFNLHIVNNKQPITLNFYFADTTIRPIGIAFVRAGSIGGTAAGNMPYPLVRTITAGSSSVANLSGPAISVTDLDITQNIGWEFYLIFQLVYDGTSTYGNGGTGGAIGIIDPQVENDN